MARDGRIRAVVRNGDGTISVPLTRGLWALIDEDCEQLNRISSMNWHAHKGKHTWYAAHNLPRKEGRRGVLLLHRLLLPGHPEIDHRDGNGLNNTRENLRPCTTAENMRNHGPQRNNTTGYKGVHFDRKSGKYKAQIKDVDGRRYLGSFDTAELAYGAYCQAALSLHGEFVRIK